MPSRIYDEGFLLINLNIGINSKNADFEVFISMIGYTKLILKESIILNENDPLEIQNLSLKINS